MSSFLASEPGHKIVSVWLKRTAEHWSTPFSSRPNLGFFWLHKLFGHMVGDPIVGKFDPKSVDADVKRRWELVPRVSGEYGVTGPHFWVKYTDKLKPAPTAEHQAVIDGDRDTPMFKLTNHEVKLRDVGPESCYWVLLRTTQRQAQEYAARSPEVGLAVVKRLLATGDAVGCRGSM